MSTFPCKITFDDYATHVARGLFPPCRKRVLFLVGVSYSGKSTFAEKLRERFSCVVISSDKYIEAYAVENAMSYADAFKKRASLAMDVAMGDFKEALSSGEDLIVIDQTNLTWRSRKRKLNMIPRDSGYACEAMVFPLRAWDELEQLIERRKDKIIPRDVLVQQHKARRDDPCYDLEEDFNAVWMLDTSERR